MLIALPAGSCLLLALCILLLGKRGFFLSSLPVLLGVVFFIFKLINSTSWMHTVLCILLYLAIVIIYPATVFGWIRTKWLLPPLFGIPFVIHIARDLPRLSDTVNPVTFSAGMQEMSMLCMMAALMFIGFGLKKHEPEPTVVEPEVVEPAPAVKPAPVEERPEPPKREKKVKPPKPPREGPSPLRLAATAVRAGIGRFFAAIGRGFAALGAFFSRNARTVAFGFASLLMAVLAVWAIVGIRSSIHDYRVRHATVRPPAAAPAATATTASASDTAQNTPAVWSELILPPPVLYAE